MKYIHIKHIFKWPNNLEMQCNLIRKVLNINRDEISARVFSTCDVLEKKIVALYAKEDNKPYKVEEDLLPITINSSCRLFSKKSTKNVADDECGQQYFFEKTRSSSILATNLKSANSNVPKIHSGMEFPKGLHQLLKIKGSKTFAAKMCNRQKGLLFLNKTHNYESVRFYSNTSIKRKVQYDNIADKFLEMRSLLKIHELIDYTLIKQLNFEIRGQSVVDIACGSGVCTRTLKKIGAGRTVGVDISKEMIARAINEEKIKPLGIEYTVASIDEMKIESKSFDIATAVLFLHYAKNKKQLEQFMKNIYSVLKNGGTFISVNSGIGKKICMSPGYLQKYGITYKIQDVSGSDSQVIVTLSRGDFNVDLQMYNYTKEDFKEAAEMVGFRNVEFCPLEFPEHMEGAPYWGTLKQYCPIEFMICRK